MVEPETPIQEKDQAPHISAENARGGEIILRTRRRRIIFIAGLVGFVILALLLKFSGFL